SRISSPSHLNPSLYQRPDFLQMDPISPIADAFPGAIEWSSDTQDLRIDNHIIRIAIRLEPVNNRSNSFSSAIQDIPDYSSDVQPHGQSSSMTDSEPDYISLLSGPDAMPSVTSPSSPMDAQPESISILSQPRDTPSPSSFSPMDAQPENTNMPSQAGNRTPPSPCSTTDASSDYMSLSSETRERTGPGIPLSITTQQLETGPSEIGILMEQIEEIEGRQRIILDALVAMEGRQTEFEAVLTSIKSHRLTLEEEWDHLEGMRRRRQREFADRDRQESMNFAQEDSQGALASTALRRTTVISTTRKMSFVHRALS
ncbi:MAG: hypothetical protein Q9198_000063, partial [Flavoplaca austrocitrina]